LTSLFVYLDWFNKYKESIRFIIYTDKQEEIKINRLTDTLMDSRLHIKFI